MKSKLKFIFKSLLILSFLCLIGYITLNTTADGRQVFYKFAGGLAIFLFGMTQLTSSLEILAGSKIKKLFELFATNRFLAVISGLTVTAIIQSSSATTVMVVGFVNAALMTLTQAAGVIMGANIGTTITGQLLAFRLDHYAYLFVAVGVLIFLLSKSQRNRMTGMALISFAFLFIGLGYMKEVVTPLNNSAEIQGIITAMSGNLFLAILSGTILTIVLQSSSATVAVTMATAAAGLITFPAAVGIILGENIGTTITAQLAALPARRNARRAAMIHTVFNLAGVLIAALVFNYYVQLVEFFSGPDARIERMIANAHSLFNILNVLLFLPLINILVALTIRLIPLSEDEQHQKNCFLDKRLLQVPALAVQAARQECLRMARLTEENLNSAIELMKKFDYKRSNRILEREKLIDSLENDILNYIMLIEEKYLTKNESSEITRLIHLATNLERVSDQAENILKITRDKHERKIKFSESAELELAQMSILTVEMFDNSLKIFFEKNNQLIKSIIDSENQINLAEQTNRVHHVERLNQGRCDLAAGYFFLDLMEKLEKICDHCVNISQLNTEISVKL